MMKTIVLALALVLAVIAITADAGYLYGGGYGG